MNEIEQTVEKTKTFIENLLLIFNHKFNDKTTRNLIRDTIGLAIKKPQNYIATVQCNEENNPPAIIEANQLVVEVVFYPKKKEIPPINPNYRITARLDNKHANPDKKDSLYVEMFKEKIRDK